MPLSNTVLIKANKNIFVKHVVSYSVIPLEPYIIDQRTNMELVFLKMIKYTIKAEAKTAFTYMQAMKSTHTIPVGQICKQSMPIDVKQAYGEYHYGILS